MATTLKFKVTFIEGVLGTCTNNKEIYREFIASKSPDASTVEDEVAAVGVDEVVEKTMTVFPRDEEGRPFLYDYQVKGFFKDTCSALSRVPDSKSSKLKAFKKVIDGCIFPEPRKAPFVFDGEIGMCQRPLRAQTAQGERISLACSEELPAGTSVEFSVVCLNDAHAALVREWMDYGRYKGFLQWRNSGKGRFTYEEITD